MGWDGGQISLGVGEAFSILECGYPRWSNDAPFLFNQTFCMICILLFS